MTLESQDMEVALRVIETLEDLGLSYHLGGSIASSVHGIPRQNREGNEVSDRQWSDILGVLKAQGKRLDQDYLSYWAGELGVDDLLQRALADSDR